MTSEPSWRGVPRSLADGAVDRLAQEVGVPVVARVLLDHVGQDPPQADRAVVRMVEAPIERLALGSDAAGAVDLLSPDAERLGDIGRLDLPVGVAQVGTAVPVV